MKYLGLFKLSHRLITTYKKRHFLIIISIGALFSIILASGFILHGLEQTLIDANSHQIETVQSNYQKTSYSSRQQTSKNAILLQQNPTIDFPTSNQSLNQTASSKDYHKNPHFVGKIIFYKNLGFVADSQLAKYLLPFTANQSSTSSLSHFSEKSSALTSSNKSPSHQSPSAPIPILLSVSKASSIFDLPIPSRKSPPEQASAIDKIRTQTLGKVFSQSAPNPSSLHSDDANTNSSNSDNSDNSNHPDANSDANSDNSLQFYVAGFLPTSDQISIANNPYDKTNPLEYFIAASNSTYNTTTSPNFLILDYKNYIRDSFPTPTLSSTNLNTPPTSQSSLATLITPSYHYSIFAFDSLKSALSFYSSNQSRFLELFTNTIAIHQTFQLFYSLLYLVSFILAIIAIFIIFFTFLRIIDQQTSTIALYRAFGASPFDIFRIYAAYLFELIIFTAIFALATATVLSFIVLLLSQPHLSATLNANLGYQTPLPLFSFTILSSHTAIFLSVLILLSPLPAYLFLAKKTHSIPKMSDIKS